MMDYLNWIVANPWSAFLIAMCATWFTTEVIEAIGKAIGNARCK